MKKQILALLLALLMTAPAFVSCSDSGTNEETADSGSAPTASEEIAPEEIVDDTVDENGYLKDELPDELDFGGQVINLLYWSDVENQEFSAEEFTGEIVNDAIYQRNINVEDDLNVKYNWIGTPGNGGSGGSGGAGGSGGKVYSGKGISTDIVAAGIHAYLSALNKIVYEEDNA